MDDLKFKNAAGNAVIIKSDGKVGIGTTNPDASLKIRGVGADATTQSLNVCDSNNSSMLYVRNDGVVQVSKNYFWASSSQGAYIGSNGNGRLRARGGITNDQDYLRLGGNNSISDLNIRSGNVGIGTDSPTAQLDVLGSGKFSQGLFVDGNPVMTGASDLDTDTLQTVTDRGATTTNRIVINKTAGELLTLNSTDAGANFINFDRAGTTKVLMGFDSSSNAIFSINNTDAAGALSFSTPSSIQFSVNSAERMRIRNNGFVGIGTNIPRSNLHVYAASNAPEFRISRASNGQVWTQSIDSSARFQLKEAASEGGTQNLRFQIDDDGETLLAPNGGNVGIGTTNPQSKLEVHGQLKIESSVDDMLHLNATDSGPIYIAFDRAGDRHALVGFAGTSDSFQINNEESGGDISFSALNFQRFLTAGSEAMRIASDGDISVGTNVAQARFDVRGTGRFVSNAPYKANEIISSPNISGHATDTSAIIHNDVLNPYGVFGNKQILSQLANNRFFGRGRQFIITSGVDINNQVTVGTSQSEKFTDGNNEQTAVAVAANRGDIVFNINVTGNNPQSSQGYQPTNGYTYVDGVLVLDFYHVNTGQITDVKWKDKDGNIRTSSPHVQGPYKTKGYGGLHQVFCNLAGNYLTEIQFTLKNNPNNTTSFTQVSYVGKRMANLEGPFVTTNGGNIYHEICGYEYGTVAGDGGAKTLKIDPNGDSYFDTDTLYVDASTDRVGINMTNPTFTLDVNGRIRTKQDLFLDGNFVIKNITSHLFLDAAAGKDINFRPNNGNQAAIITSAGKVGIGTANPLDNLTVNLAANGDSVGFMHGPSRALEFERISFDDVRITNTRAFTSLLALGTAGGVGINIKGQGDGNGSFVGIGTTSPNVPLEIKGSVGSNLFGINTTTHGNFRIGPATANSRTAMKISSDNGALDLKFISSSNRIYFGGDGNAQKVGINTASPNAPLDVRGSATDDAPVLRIHNTNNGKGATIQFNDNSSSLQNGNITYRHADSQSQGGGASFHITGEADTTLVVGNSTNKGRIVVSSASSSEADYGFYDNVNMGMSRLGNNELGFLTAGVERMRIDSVGRVGISNNDPQNLLHVKAADGVSADTYVALFENDEATAGDNFGVKIEAGSNSSDVALEVNSKAGSSLMRVRGDGNVGIGTNNPLNPLHVFGGDLRITSDQATAGDGKPTILFSETDNSNSHCALMYDGDNLGGDANRFSIVLNGGSAISKTTASQEKLVVNAAGNVGIGTTGPTSPLTIKSNSISSNDSALTIQGNSNTNPIVKIAEKATDGARFHMYDGNVEKIAFYSDGTNNHISAGNFGIGTNSPDDGKLQVLQDNGGFTIVAGADVTAQSLTNDTRKFTRIGMPHYHNAEQPVILMVGDSNGTSNVVNIGGGSSAGNAATQIVFKTAANDATTNGTERMQINSAGNVGIGTDSPSAILDVKPTTTYGGITVGGNVVPRIVFNGSNDSSNYWGVGIHDNNATQFAIGRNQVGHEAMTDHLVISSAGNVGIGTTVPSQRLHVHGNTQLDGSTIFYGATSNAGSRALSLIYGTYNGVTNSFRFRQGGSTANAVAFSLYDYKPSLMLRYSSECPRVGIGVTDPSASLEVYGPEGKGSILMGSGIYPSYNAITLNGSTSQNDYNFISSSADKNLYINRSSSKSIFFRENNSTQMVIEAGGNVGIGTNNPAYKLHNAGTSRLEGKVTLGGSVNNTIQGQGLGMNFKAAGDFNFFTTADGGSQKIVFKGDGKVGIGTTSPDTKLNLYSNGTDTLPQLTIQQDGAGDAGLRLLAGGNAWSLGMDNSNGEYFGISNVNYGIDTSAEFIITQAGKVGIGTHSPASNAFLHVTGNILSFSTDGSDRYSLAGVQATDSNFRYAGLRFDRSNNVAKFGHYLNSSLIENGFIAITENGHVGVGTQVPLAFDTTPTRFHVRHAGSAVCEVARFEGTSDANGAGALVRIGTSNDRGIYFEGGRTGTVPYGAIGVTEFNGAKTEAIRIESDGKIGIGTTDPVRKLSVFDNSDQNGEVLDLKGNASYGGTIRFRRGDSYSFRAGIGGGSSTNSNIPSSYWGVEDPHANLVGISVAHTTAYVGIRKTVPTCELDVGGDIKADGLISSDQIRTKRYTSLSGSDEDFFPIGTITDQHTGPVHFSVNTYAHSSMDFIVSEGFSGHEFGYITLLSSIVSANSGYANITAVRVRADGTVEIKLEFSSGPIVDVSVTARSTDHPVSLPSSLATSTSTSTVIHTVVNQNQKFEAKNIVASNSVGIGTTNPSVPLEVAGIIKTSTSLVANAAIVNQVTAATANGDITIKNNNGVDLARFTHAGDVGIGTTDPLGTTHIYTADAGGTIATNASHDDLIIENNGNVGIQLSSPASSFQYLAFGDTASANQGYVRYYHAVDRMDLRAGGSDILSLVGNKVGIGTTAPEEKLHILNDSVNGTAHEPLIIDGHTQNHTVAGSSQAISFKGTSDGYFGAVGGYGNGSVGGMGIWAGSTNNTTPEVFVKSLAVGIGTTAPEGILHMQDAGNMSVILNSTTNDADVQFKIGTGPTSAPIDNGVSLLYQGASTNNFKISNHGKPNSSMSFETRQAGGSIVEAIRIDANQNVGIGTASPQTKLDVNGTIKSAVYAIGSLPSASPAGQRAFVNNSTVGVGSTTVGAGVTSYAGGYNAIPVYSDGSIWRIG